MVNMRGIVEDIQVLFNYPKPGIFFLEKGSIVAFSQWLKGDPLRISILSKQWQVAVFKTQLDTYENNRARCNALKKLGIQINKRHKNPKDNLFVEEVERTFFSNADEDHRQLAEFYVMVRREVERGMVNIITQDRSFERIPLVNTYYVGTSPRTGSQDLPAQFDFFQDFHIHNLLAKKIKDHIGVSPNGVTIHEAIVELEDYLQTLTGLNSEGRTLMDQAFKLDGSHCKINPLTDPDPQHSQQNEQKGFREIYCGTWTGLRNPLAHEGTGGEFAQSRYPDKTTLLKYLSFLSILFERADGPLP
jgi:uncharacterized protein (TIGR02391 family)